MLHQMELEWSGIVELSEQFHSKPYLQQQYIEREEKNSRLAIGTQLSEHLAHTHDQIIVDDLKDF
jgi:hypothetical protein